MSVLQRLCYCSRARGGSGNNIPHELASIVIQGRRFNNAHGVTGHLSYRKGSYLQIIEGPTSVIDDLYGRIRRDPRHSDVTTLAREHDVDRRLFEHWHLQLASGQGPCPEVVRYLGQHLDALNQLDRTGKMLLRPFFRLDGAKRVEHDSGFPSIEDSATHEFRLSATPLRLDRLDRLAERMEIIALLLRQWFSFRLLCQASAHDSDFVYETLAHPLLRDVIQFREADGAQSSDTRRLRASGQGAAGRTPSLYGELKSMFVRFLSR